jgi:hypothetical protein
MPAPAMPAKTLEALKASIEKWERNAVAKFLRETTIAAWDCPLCQLFVLKSDSHGCEGCPVAEKAGRDLCNGSPWEQAYDARLQWMEDEANGAAFHEAARAEVAFLKSLLPTDAERP